MQLSVYVTSLTMNYVHTGWLRGAAGETDSPMICYEEKT